MRVAFATSWVLLLVSACGGGSDGLTCNGYAELCDRSLDEIAVPATHNSMSNALDPTWVLGTHHGDIRDQLEFGIRGLLIDTYYGIATDERVVIAPEPYETAGVDERSVYLCHGYCELGATGLVDALTDIRDFLRDNPNEVLVLFIQDQISPEDTAGAFEESGLISYVYTHEAGEQWPTLRTMIERGQRVLVMAENDASGPDWYHDGFKLTQDTPYSFPSPKDFSCEPNRGQPDSPLFLLNHWISKTEPSPDDAAVVNDFDVLLARARECQSKRGLFPNLIAVNFYDIGDLLRVVDVLNGVASEP